MKKSTRTILIIGALFLVAVAGAFYYFESRLFVPLKLENPYVYVPSNASFEQVIDTLKEHEILRDERLFRQLSAYMKYKRSPMRSGRFKVQPGWTMVQLIRHLRAGGQDPVDVVLTTERLPEEVAAKAARFLEADSMDFVTLFYDSVHLQKIGYSRETLMSVFIPNTYEMYWTTTPEQFLERMVKEHDNFWAQNGRKDKARRLGLNPAEVYTLASIVERETLRDDERPRMAGVYLNRLRVGMRLQADPTAVFARRDFDAPRVTWYHTKFDSPYNTYMYAGLPPGPITMASIRSIDGVLNAEPHNYYYFCALGDGTERHAFAETLQGHNQNVQRYKENLRKRGLM